MRMSIRVVEILSALEHPSRKSATNLTPGFGPAAELP